jgi:hypothetical protein
MLNFSIDGLYPNGSLFGVWGSSDKNVFAVGGDFFGGGILNYDGGAWIEMNSDLSGTLYALWGSSLTDIFAVGFGYRILHYSGPTETTSTSSTTSTMSDNICPPEYIYGEFSQETALMKAFRNNVLNKTPEGREIVRLYYQWSPVIVKAMKADEEFKQEIRELMDEVLLVIDETVE